LETPQKASRRAGKEHHAKVGEGRKAASSHANLTLKKTGKSEKGDLRSRVAKKSKHL